MSQLKNETENKYESFLNDWTKQASANWNILSGDQRLKDSYARLCSFQAWKSEILQGTMERDALAFFAEAHNDAMASHVNASIGAWRSALQALRSCIEDSLFALYYMDHPIELELWLSGGHKLTFTELFNYFSRHPRLVDFPGDVSGLDAIKEEYGTLSKAVHGSAASFRMTGDGATVLLWNTDKAKLGQWAARERATLQALFSLMCCIFRRQLEGTQRTSLRRILFFSIGRASREKLKRHIHIQIPEPR